MCLIKYNQGYSLDLEQIIFYVISESLRSHEEYSFSLIDFTPLLWYYFPCQLNYMLIFYDWYALKTLHLLVNKRFIRGQEKYKALFKPKIVVENHICCYEGLSKACGQTYESVIEKGCFSHLKLVFSELFDL